MDTTSIISALDIFKAKLTRLRPGRGQTLEAETEAKILTSRPVWPRGLNVLSYLFFIYCFFLCFFFFVALVANKGI